MPTFFFTRLYPMRKFARIYLRFSKLTFHAVLIHYISKESLFPNLSFVITESLNVKASGNKVMRWCAFRKQ